MYRKIRFFICFFFIVILCGCSAKSMDKTVQPAAEPITEPHYYTTALQEFINDAAGKINAVLYDLDGCGNDEMIVFDEGMPGPDEHWAVTATGGRIAIFDAKDGKNISIIFEPPAYGFYAHRLFISSKCHLILYDVFEGYCYVLYRYEDGILATEAVLTDGSYADYEYYAVNGIECDEAEFLSRINYYDVKNTAVTISYGHMVRLDEDEMPTLKNDVDKILSLTSEH